MSIQLPKSNRVEKNTLTFEAALVVDWLPIGILFLDPLGSIKIYNRQAENILCVPRKQVINKDFWEPFSDLQFGFSMKEVLRDKISPGKLTITLTNGSLQAHLVDIEAAFITEETAAGQTSHPQKEGLLVQFEGQLEKEQATNDLEEQVAKIVHDIRNPLSGIKGFAALLERDLEDRADLKKLASYIVKGMDSLNAQITASLQSISRRKQK